MQARYSVLFVVLVVLALLASGCAGAGRSDVDGTVVANASGVVTNGSASQFASEFDQGFEHHSRASDLFENATELWNADDYADASRLLADAQSEYALAGDHYHNMCQYAGSSDELVFAYALEESAIDMDEASARYLLSLDEAAVGNNTTSLAYFQEGQEFMDQGMDSLNQSLALMPPSLGWDN